MEISFILKAIDKASKPIASLMKANKAAAQGAVKDVDRIAKAQERVAKAVNKDMRERFRAQRELAMAQGKYTIAAKETTKAVEETVKAHDRLAGSASKAYKTIRSGMSSSLKGIRQGIKTGFGVISGSGALGAATGMMTRHIVNPAAEMEGYLSQLARIEKSGEKAQSGLNFVLEQQIPNDLMEATRAFVVLRKEGIQPTERMFKALGDATVANKLDFENAASAYGKALKGQYGSLNQFGIVARKTGRYVTYAFKGEDGRLKTMRAAVSDLKAQEFALQKIFEMRFGGSMNADGETWNGMLQDMSNMWSVFRMEIAHAGLFDFLKGELKALMSTFEAMRSSGELKMWAQNISEGLIAAMKTIKPIVLGFWQIAQATGRAALWISQMVGGWENFGKLLAVAPFIPAIFNIALGLFRIGAGFLFLFKAGIKMVAFTKITALFKLLGILFKALLLPLALAAKAFVALGVAFIATPIGWVVAGIAAIAGAAYMIYRNWDKIGPYFRKLWDGIKNTCANAWAGFKNTLSKSWSGIVSLAESSWNGLAKFFSDLWNGIKNTTSEAWNSFTQTLRDLWNGASSLATEGWQSLQQWITGNENSAKALERHSAALRGFTGDAQQALANIAKLDPVGKNRVAYDATKAISAADNEKASLFNSLFASARGNWGESKFTEGVFLTKQLQQSVITLDEYQKALQKFQGDKIFSSQVDRMLTDSFKIDAVNKQIEAAKKAQEAIRLSENPEAVAAAQQAVSSPQAPVDMEATRRASELAKAAIDAIPPALQTAIRAAQSFASQVDFTSHGTRMMETLASGIRQGSSAAVEAVAATTKAMRDYLPHSPAKVGALSDLHRVKFSETLASSIRSEPVLARIASLTSNMRQALSEGEPRSAGLSAGFGSGGSAPVSITYAPQISIEGNDAEGRFARMLREHSDEISRLVEEAMRRKERLQY